MKISIDIAELQTITQSAIAEAEHRRKEKLAEVKAKEEQKHTVAVFKATNIVNDIPKRCAKEAEAGRNHAIVMSIGYKDHDKKSGPPYNLLTYDKLIGTAEMVWNACQEAKMNPTLEYWHDGFGEKSGFNLVVHWEKG